MVELDERSIEREAEMRPREGGRGGQLKDFSNIT